MIGPLLLTETDKMMKDFSRHIDLLSILIGVSRVHMVGDFIACRRLLVAI